MTGKVLFTASTFSHIHNFHLPYLRYFQERGWSVHVACGGERMEVPYADRVIGLPLRKQMSSPDNVKAAAMLRKEIRREGYSLVSTHTALAAFFTRLAVKGLKSRPLVVNTVHGYLFDDETKGVKKSVLLAAEQLTAPETDLLMVMNQWDDEFAKRHALGRQIVHIPGMGVDFSRFDQAVAEDGRALRAKSGISQEAFVLIDPAEFSKRKSQEVLIRAMGKLPKHTVLVLPGQGALLEECKTLAKALGLENRVLFPGQVKDMGRWYAMADAAAAASRIEGLPFNVMEAMYFGLPVAASAVKGHTDLIEDGHTGLLYPYGDIDACADALRTLVESDALRQKLSANARENVERYSLERAFPKVLAAYGALLPELAPHPVGV